VSASKGEFKGGKDLLFNLKNGGVGVGKISPKVKPAWIAQMKQFKARIIAGKLKPPAVLK
jgi:basic membrane lipoprotein Med (substrate-binding protein (PBP1-ABC) superfamily)